MERHSNTESEALGHLRVLDLTGNIAGGFCTKLLAGFGAEVVKVEPPAGGDPLRAIGPFLDHREAPERSLPFRWFNTGKKSLVLDLSRTEDRERFESLVRRAQVVVESYKPGRLEAMGLGFERLKSLNARLVFTSISNFGQTGPYRNFEAEDITLYAMSGLMSATGDPKRPPLASGPAIASLTAGLKAYIATLMACFRVQAGGGADHVDVSAHEAAMDNLEIAIAEHLHLGRVARRNRDEHALVPWRAFPCRDGYAAIIGGPIRHWLKAVEMFEEPKLMGKRYEHMADRIAHRDEVRELMAPWLLRHDKKTIFHEGQERQLAFAYVATLEEVLDYPQLEARGYLVPDEHPEGGRGRMPGAPFKLALTPWRHASAPLLGQHTEAVFESWLSAEEASPRSAGGIVAPEQPLAGVRIVDFTHDWAGPHATRVMADYGAEVIKIEYPPRLCGMRGAYLERKNAHPRWWEINRNKASITLDLHLSEHVEAAKALIRTADVLVDNSRPGVMEGFGLGYDVVKAVKRDIIYVAMSAYGASGPESRYAGYGGAIEALSGVQALTAYDREGEPLRVRELDVTNGVMGACAVMTALLHRQRTGQGQYVDLAQREASSWLIGEHILEYSTHGEQTLPMGNRHPGFAPQGCYPCRGDDRWLVLSVRSDDEWRRLCDVAGRSDWAQDERFRTVEGRRQHHDAVDDLICAWTGDHDSARLMAKLQAAGLAAGRLATVKDLAEDPHLAARNWLQHPAGDVSQTYPGFPFRFLNGGGAIGRRGADLGEDNQRILCQEVGWSPSQLPRLDDEVLGTAFDIE